MAHRRNEEFFLYTALSPTGADSYAALMFMKQTGIFFKHLHYGDPEQHAEVIKAIQSWKGGITDINFPFIVYTKVNDPQDDPSRDTEIVNGLADIQAIDWPAVANFQG
jgi:hypothetical protein